MTHYDPEILEQISRFGILDSLAWLTYIRGCAEVMLRLSDQIPQEEQKRMLEGIAQTAQRCRQMLRSKNDAFILITAENFSGPSEPLNLRSLIQDFIETRQRNAEANGLVTDIELEIASDLPLFVANEQRLGLFLQILLDLLPNSAQRMHGHLAIQKHEQDIRVTLQPLEIPSTEYQHLLSLLVRENGGGDLTIDGTVLQFTFYGNR